MESLRSMAHTDPGTGLPNRRFFLGRLGSALGAAGPGGAALLLVRVLQLDALAQRAGPASTARMLATLAALLETYPSRVPGAFAGRLNDSDFALCLPAGGVAEETAATLLRALRATPMASAGGAELVVGGIDGLRTASVSGALAAADQALAQAESAGPFCIEIHLDDETAPPALGERAWRVRIDEALHEGRARLAEHGVREAGGRLLHLACPLQLQLDVAGPFREARFWLAMAARSRLLPRVDLMALELALLAMGRDGQPRSVQVSAASLATSGFLAEVQRRLDTAPVARRLLWIEIADSVALGHVLPQLREASAAWRRAGVRLGIEHAGVSARGLARLADLGLDHVKVESRLLRGAAHESAIQHFAAGLLALVHGMGLRAIAEGIDDADDLAMLWALGFDAATGPALDTAKDQAMSPT